jgi:hypothetical protein
MLSYKVVSCIIQVAEDNIGKGSMVDSAALCLDDARACLARGDLPHARERALNSLAYSVGIFGLAYREACQL